MERIIHDLFLSVLSFLAGVGVAPIVYRAKGKIVIAVPDKRRQKRCK